MSIQPQYRIYASFFLFALALGAMLSRMPDLQTHLGVTQGQLGLTLIGMSIGSLISITVVTPLIERLGARITGLITVLGSALCFALVPWMPTAWAMFATLFVAGMLTGALEINLNLETDRLEAQSGRRYMNRAHGFWSLGFFVAALTGATIRQAAVVPVVHLGLVSLVAIVVAGALLWNMVPAPPRPLDPDAEPTPRFAIPTVGLLPLCLIGIAAFLIEGSGVDWSAIYMRDEFAAQPFIGGLGLTLFGFFMAMMRLFADPVVGRFGPRHVSMLLLSVATVGALCIVFAPVDVVALTGFALLGIGCSAVYPLAVSAAAQRTDRSAAVNVAALAQVTFVVFFLGPPLLGFIAQYFGLRVSYLVTVPVILLGLVASRVLPTRAVDTPARLEPEPATPLG